MAKLSYQLIHLLFKKLRAEDETAHNKVFVSDYRIDPQVATERVFEKASGFLAKNFSDDNKGEKIYRNLFRKHGKANVWNEVFREGRHFIKKDDFKKYLATDKSWVETLYKHYLDYKSYGGNTRGKVCHTLTFYFGFCGIEELERDIKKGCPELKKLFLEEPYRGLFDNLPKTPEPKKETGKTRKRGFNANMLVKVWAIVATLLFLVAVSPVEKYLAQDGQGKSDQNTANSFLQNTQHTSKALSKTEQAKAQELLSKFNLSMQGNAVTLEEHFECAKNSKESWYFCTYVYWLDTYGEFLELIGSQLIAGERKVKILFPDNERNREMVKSYVAMHKEKNPDIEKYLKTLPAQFPEFMRDLLNTFTIYDPLTGMEQTLLIEPDVLEIESETESPFFPVDIRLSKRKSAKYVRTFIKIWNKTALEQGKPEDWLILQDNNELQWLQKDLIP